MAIFSRKARAAAALVAPNVARWKAGIAERRASIDAAVMTAVSPRRATAGGPASCALVDRAGRSAVPHAMAIVTTGTSERVEPADRLELLPLGDRRGRRDRPAGAAFLARG